MLVHDEPLLEKVVVGVFGDPLVNLANLFEVDLAAHDFAGLLVDQLSVDL